MGGWKLEVGKMFLYMAFPVGMFHYFNQPENFEAYVTNYKKNSYHPPENKEEVRQLKEFIAERRRRDEMEQLKALESKAK